MPESEVRRPLWTLNLYREAGEAGGAFRAPEREAAGGRRDPERAAAEAARRQRPPIRTRPCRGARPHPSGGSRPRLTARVPATVPPAARSARALRLTTTAGAGGPSAPPTADDTDADSASSHRSSR